MADTINFFEAYALAAVAEYINPKASFFKDRYFPTSGSDIFRADKVLTEYRSGDDKMAAFVAPGAGDIPIERRSYEVREYAPAKISASRLLTEDMLRARGFGEAIYTNEADKARRAAAIILDDMNDLSARITRSEEWMASQVMINNGCDIQTYVDGQTAGEVEHLAFYTGTSDHTYTVSTPWASFAAMRADVRQMCRSLSERGIAAQDLVIGTSVADAMIGWTDFQNLVNKNSGIEIGSIAETLAGYPGVAYMGTINFGGYKLNVICVDEKYTAIGGASTNYFPADAALVTAPGCGHMMYAQITQIDFGASEFVDHVGSRIPKLVVDQDKDVRKLVIGARPLAVPKQHSPFVYAASVI